ncbi:hypothetical protein CBR_g29491 [Chara braunii]|uniref:Ion transport domain-containing protein n=1 Tax=Chara braunii TaxID=69332 RepID=A0A388LAJ5_CHABU|nr:hypothetical protein CBR_g29491 [Chara braunii]|eukprot:GBG79341.1 hypothetical protein CBR_g29491 [Chara braunii]
MTTEKGGMQPPVDIAARSSVFRNQLYQIFQVSDMSKRLNLSEGKSGPAYSSHDILRDPEILRSILMENPLQFIDFKEFKKVAGSTDEGRKRVPQLERPRPTIYATISLWAGWISNHEWFQNGVMMLIFLNAVVVGVELELDPAFHADELRALRLTEIAILIMFMIEIFIKWVHSFKEFWDDNWNIFDFLITTVSAIPEFIILAMPQGASSNAAASIASRLRIFRTLRSLKMVARFWSLRVIVHTLLQAFQSMFFIMILLSILLYIYAIFALNLFESYSLSRDPALVYQYKLKDIPNTLAMLFQMLTLDQWYNMQREVSTKVNKAVTLLYFISWIWIGAFVFRNIIVAVMVRNFANIAEQMEAADALKRKQAKKKVKRTQKARKPLSAAARRWHAPPTVHQPEDHHLGDGQILKGSKGPLTGSPDRPGSEGKGQPGSAEEHQGTNVMGKVGGGIGVAPFPWVGGDPKKLHTLPAGLSPRKSAREAMFRGNAADFPKGWQPYLQKARRNVEAPQTGLLEKGQVAADAPLKNSAGDMRGGPLDYDSRSGQGRAGGPAISKQTPQDQPHMPKVPFSEPPLERLATPARGDAAAGAESSGQERELHPSQEFEPVTATTGVQGERLDLDQLDSHSPDEGVEGSQAPHAHQQGPRRSETASENQSPTLRAAELVAGGEQPSSHKRNALARNVESGETSAEKGKGRLLTGMRPAMYKGNLPLFEGDAGMSGSPGPSRKQSREGMRDTDKDSRQTGEAAVAASKPAEKERAIPGDGGGVGTEEMDTLKANAETKRSPRHTWDGNMGSLNLAGTNSEREQPTSTRSPLRESMTFQVSQDAAMGGQGGGLHGSNALPMRFAAAASAMGYPNDGGLEWSTALRQLRAIITLHATEALWPKDTLFRYLQIMEKLQESLKEYQKLQHLAAMTLHSIQDYDDEKSFHFRGNALQNGNYSLG